jgi:hypothetical protein
VAVTCLACTEDLSLLAVGLGMDLEFIRCDHFINAKKKKKKKAQKKNLIGFIENGAIVLFRGDLVRDRNCKSKVLRIGEEVLRAHLNST